MLVVTIVQHRTSVLDKTACVCSKTSRAEHTKSVHNRPNPAVFVRTAQGLSSNQNEVAINSKSGLWRTALLASSDPAAVTGATQLSRMRAAHPSFAEPSIDPRVTIFAGGRSRRTTPILCSQYSLGNDNFTRIMFSRRRYCFRQRKPPECPSPWQPGNDKARALLRPGQNANCADFLQMTLYCRLSRRVVIV